MLFPTFRMFLRSLAKISSNPSVSPLSAVRVVGRGKYGISPFLRPILIGSQGFSSNATPQGRYSKFGVNCADMLNSALVKYPKETIGCVMGLEIVSLYGTYLILRAIPGAEELISLNFAVAFALSRPIRRVRLPLDLAVTAALCRIVPSLTLVKITKLASLFPSPNVAKDSVAGKALGMAKEVADKYGIGYLVGSRVSGIAVVLSLWGMLSVGVDVSDVLVSTFGWEKSTVDNVGAVLGTWAASVTFAGLFYPFTVLGGGLMAHRIGYWRTIG